MFKNYFKLSYRNLLRNKLTSFVSIFGLSVAIGCSIVFFLLLDMEYTSDHFHENAESIFMVGYTLEGDKGKQRWGDSPRPLGPTLQSEFPQIIRTVRFAENRGVIRFENKVFNESIRFVDPAFLAMFTFPLKWGEKTALLDRNALILSEKASEKYFGNDNPIGRPVIVSLDRVHQETFFVRGVAEKFPHNASFGFHILASYEKIGELLKHDPDDWGSLTRATFIQVSHHEEIHVISAQMDRYIQRHNEDRVDRPIDSFIFEPLPTLSWESQHIERSISSGSTPEALIILFIIGLFLLLQACLNFINISLASGARRLKEIAVRKVMGGRRIQLIKQFLGENLFLCILALLGGLLLTEVVLLPGFYYVTGSQEEISLIDFLNGMHLPLFLVLLVVLTGFVAGAYPALYVSKLQPVRIFTGKFKFKGRKGFKTILIALQFGITFVLICMVITFLQNNRYQLERDWGYDQNQVIYVRLENNSQFEILKNTVSQETNLVQTSGTVHHIGRSNEHAVVEVAANKHEVVLFDVGSNYLETMGLRLDKGRFFSPDLATDSEIGLLVNERFVYEMGWEQPIDQTVRYENKDYRVIGVLEDFHYANFFEEIKPAMIRLFQDRHLNYLVTRTRRGSEMQSAEFLQAKWMQLFPDIPYSGFFQEDVFDVAFRNNTTITRIFVATTIIGLIISCMGLFGLVTLVISLRSKEFSIHKVFGASIARIAGLIWWRISILIILSMLVAAPFAYTFLKELLNGIYSYHMNLGAWPFILGALVNLLTAGLTIASQVYKAAVRNPVNALRHE